MWTYKKQIIARWVFFAIGAMICLLLVAFLFRLYPETLGKHELKQFFTQLSVHAEFLPLYLIPVYFMIVTGLLLLGCPTFIIFPPLYLILGFAMSFSIVVATQVCASIIAIYYSRKKSLHNSIPAAIKISLAGTSATDFSFWTRLYINFPQRTIDMIASGLLKNDESNTRLLMPTLLATILRNLLPSIWFASFINLTTGISVDHTQATSSFLTWSSLLVAYIALPKIPELLICKPGIKPVLSDIENWDSSQKESGERRPRKKIKLGMQSRPSLQ